MMHVPLTLVLLAALTAVAVLLRIRWPLLSRRWRAVLIALAFSALLADAFMHVSKWEPNSEHLYRLVNWIAVAGYLFLLILWTRMAPRWLTTLSAVVLVLPLLASRRYCIRWRRSLMTRLISARRSEILYSSCEPPGVQSLGGLRVWI